MNDTKRKDGSSSSDGINNNTYDLLFSDFKFLPVDNKNNIINFKIFNTIDKYTRFQEKEIFSKLLKRYYKHYNIDLNKIFFNKHTNQYEYRDGDIEISFDKLSNCFNDGDLTRELMSKKRYNKCHIRSLSVASSINDAKVVTGYITVLDHKYLHSVVEIVEDGEIYFLDWTRNIKMLKDDYVSLTDFVELSSFDGKNVVDDVNIYFKKLGISSKAYVLFRDELVKDLDKNTDLFNEGKRR